MLIYTLASARAHAVYTRAQIHTPTEIKIFPFGRLLGDKCLFANTYQGRQRVRADGVSQPPPTPFVSPVLMPRHRSRYSCKAEWTYRREGPGQVGEYLLATDVSGGQKSNAGLVKFAAVPQTTAPPPPPVPHIGNVHSPLKRR